MTALLEVRHLRKTFVTSGSRWSRQAPEEFVALQDLSFSVAPATTLGIVGESGSGKTTLVRSILRAIDPTSGEAWFNSRQFGRVDLAQLNESELKPLRREMQMVFQDPFSSLNPRMTVGDILEEPLVIHGLDGLDQKEAETRPGSRSKAQARRQRVAEMLDRVGLPKASTSRFPHAFSGGQRQRIGIARALMLDPQLVVCDESVSALDVSVQAQVINLLLDLQSDLGLTYLFVAHDLAVVRHLCDDVLVMYQGAMVEQGSVAAIFDAPTSDYTRLLLSAIPSPDPDVPLDPLERSQLNLPS